jgi:hypothetical protein
MRYPESIGFLSMERAMTSKKHPVSHSVEAPSAAETADRRLDEALEESFPASDPIAVDLAEPHRSTETPSARKKTQ